MDRCEDEIDAYICAYVALYYWTHGLAHCRVVGDLASGYIITPVTEQMAIWSLTSFMTVRPAERLLWHGLGMGRK